MRKLLATLIISILFSSIAYADLAIEIISPSSVKDTPGIEEVIKAEVNNKGKETISDLLVYITMADLDSKMTVNLEDYFADRPVYIERLMPKETQIVEIPIRFVYTSKYHLYMTVVTRNSNVITSSKAIPIEIVGNTKISKPIAIAISVVEPIVLLIIAGIVFTARKKKYKSI